MDVTPLFKACVKTVKTRNKMWSTSSLVASPSGGGSGDKTRILNNNKTKSEFYVKCKDLMTCISKLKDFLLENRKNYINTGNLMSDSTSMSDVQRDQIDSEAQNIIRQCLHSIREFEAKVQQQQEEKEKKTQLFFHQEAVVGLIENYLKRVCKIYSEQRAIRIKRIIDLQKISKLDSRVQNEAPISVGNSISPLESPVQNKTLLELDSSSDKTTDSSSIYRDEDVLSSEEIQMFEHENEKLYEEFTSLTAEIKQIEGKVVEISKLQDIFAEKVLDQGKGIEEVADTVIGTTETIKDANEEIREAMKKNASFRVWILFFLLVLSFSLLFLDWYNP